MHRWQMLILVTKVILAELADAIAEGPEGLGNPVILMSLSLKQPSLLWPMLSHQRIRSWVGPRGWCKEAYGGRSAGTRTLVCEQGRQMTYFPDSFAMILQGRARMSASFTICSAVAMASPE
jgi:hypothetical protein